MCIYTYRYTYTSVCVGGPCRHPPLCRQQVQISTQRFAPVGFFMIKMKRCSAGFDSVVACFPDILLASFPDTILFLADIIVI
jgi:hypothetical protein